MIRVTVWNEFHHERVNAEVKAIYPEGMHKVIADFLESDDIKVRTATLWEEECGLTEEVLKDTDVLIWWGHCKHALVPDEIAERVRDHVRAGMGFIALHSSHLCKPFKLLMGTSCCLSWRMDDMERVWNIKPAHPIAQGLDRYFEIPRDEVYAEPFGIPEPDEVVFIGWFEGGEVFRSGCTFHRDNGKIFYFQPGHETFPVYYNENVQTIIRNAVYWAKPVIRTETISCINIKRIGTEE